MGAQKLIALTSSKADQNANAQTVLCCCSLKGCLIHRHLYLGYPFLAHFLLLQLYPKICCISVAGKGTLKHTLAVHCDVFLFKHVCNLADHLVAYTHIHMRVHIMRKHLLNEFPSYVLFFSLFLFDTPILMFWCYFSSSCSSL